MGYRTQRVDRALVLHWTSTPTLVDVRALGPDLIGAARAANGELALWIVIPTDTTDLPSAEVREQFQRIAPEIFRHCASVDLVIEGAGMRATLMRTVIRGMGVVTRTSDRVFVHDGIEAALSKRAVSSTLATALRAAI